MYKLIFFLVKINKYISLAIFVLFFVLLIPLAILYSFFFNLIFSPISPYQINQTEILISECTNKFDAYLI